MIVLASEDIYLAVSLYVTPSNRRNTSNAVQLTPLSQKKNKLLSILYTGTTAMRCAHVYK